MKLFGFNSFKNKIKQKTINKNFLSYISTKNNIILDDNDFIILKPTYNSLYRSLSLYYDVFDARLVSIALEFTYIIYSKEFDECFIISKPTGNVELLFCNHDIKNIREYFINRFSYIAEQFIFDINKIKPLMSYNPENIIFFDHSKESIILEAISGSPTVIKYIKNQTEKIIKHAIDTNPLSFKYINNDLLSDDLKFYISTKYCPYIQHLNIDNLGTNELELLCDMHGSNILYYNKFPYFIIEKFLYEDVGNYYKIKQPCEQTKILYRLIS